jgi:hypothetical protein
MSKSLLKSGLIGGLVVFIWGLISWMILPWHQQCFHSFKHEERVASAIKDNAPMKGIYIIPYTFSHDENSSSKEMDRSMEKMEKGPFVFAAVVPEGLGLQGVKPLIFSFFFQVIGALILSWMFLQAKGLTLKKKVWMGCLFGIGVGVLGVFPAWNWVGFSLGYVMMHMVDLVIGWSLAGYVLARVSK